MTFPAELRTRLESMVETWSNQSFDDAFLPVQEFEIQCARERDLAIAEESGDPQKVLEVREREYRRRVVERYGSIELRGIQLNHRVILDLDQVYIPLHFEELSLPTGDGREQTALFDMPRRRTIAGILEGSSRVFLIGAPGSGKSTLVSFLANGCAVGKHGLSWPKRALPFVITVREMKDAAICPEWIASHLGIALELVMAALDEKRAVLLVDGMDEAPEELRRRLVVALARLTSQYTQMPVIVTSRPAGAPGEIESCLPRFLHFRLTDFTDDEVNTFVDKWCLAAERSARPDSTEAEQQGNLAAADLKARIARSRPVQRIAVNPLLTTILCVVHRFLGRTIPEHRVTLYEKCTDALLYEWDRAKFPKDAAVGNLDANQKRALLRGVASALHEMHRAEMLEAEVVGHFAAMLPQMGQQVPCAADCRSLCADAGTAPGCCWHQLRKSAGLDTAGTLSETGCAGHGSRAAHGCAPAAIVSVSGDLPAHGAGVGSFAWVERHRSTERHPDWRDERHRTGKLCPENAAGPPSSDNQSRRSQRLQQITPPSPYSAISRRPKSLSRSDTEREWSVPKPLLGRRQVTINLVAASACNKSRRRRRIRQFRAAQKAFRYVFMNNAG